ncbi:hypothetical protein D3C71_1252410 [compost metagenome]
MRTDVQCRFDVIDLIDSARWAFIVPFGTKDRFPKIGIQVDQFSARLKYTFHLAVACFKIGDGPRHQPSEDEVKGVGFKL